MAEETEATLQDLWHVGFVVRDIEAAIRFYTEALGLTLRHRQVQENEYTADLVGYPGAKLKVAQFQLPGRAPSRSGHMVELIEYVRPPGEPTEPENKRITAGHLAFEVDHIEPMKARLEAYGATFYSGILDITAGINAGGKAIYLRDPDGITLELIEPPEVPGTPSLD